MTDHPQPTLVRGRPRSLLVAVDPRYDAAGAAVDAAGVLAAALGAEVVLAGWGSTGPAIVDAARREATDLVVVPMRRATPVGHVLHDGADRYVLHHSDVPVLVVPVEPHDPALERSEAPAGTAA